MATVSFLGEFPLLLSEFVLLYISQILETSDMVRELPITKLSVVVMIIAFENIVLTRTQRGLLG